MNEKHRRVRSMRCPPLPPKVYEEHECVFQRVWFVGMRREKLGFEVALAVAESRVLEGHVGSTTPLNSDRDLARKLSDVWWS